MVFIHKFRKKEIQLLLSFNFVPINIFIPSFNSSTNMLSTTSKTSTTSITSITSKITATTATTSTTSTTSTTTTTTSKTSTTLTKTSTSTTKQYISVFIYFDHRQSVTAVSSNPTGLCSVRPGQ